MNKIDELANTIVNYSISVEEKENVLITTDTFEALPLIKKIIDYIYKNKGNVEVRFSDATINSKVLGYVSDEKIKLMTKQKKFDVDNFDCFIAIRCSTNDYENSKVNKDNIKRINKALEKYNDIRVNEKKWVLLNYPTHLDAHKAKMPYDDFKEYAFDVMTVNYQKMGKDIEALKSLMEKTDRVRLTGKDTDITFSIKNMPIIPCVGDKNIPDGEIYCAPLKTSVNGTIKYNTPSPYRGTVFNGVKLTFENGKIVSATCDNKEEEQKLNEIFDTDEGSRYIGEFSIGLNPLIKDPMGDILYDEKIIGSIHFTPGMAYEDSFNGNKSTIHWDMVLIQREEYGGGNIYFDDKLIRENGIFVIPELEHLNMKNK